jgi:hypothetical protein
MPIILYLGGRDWEDHGSRPTRAKVNETPSQQISQAWWYMSVIPALWECRLEDRSLGQPREKSMRHDLKNKTKLN